MILMEVLAGYAVISLSIHIVSTALAWRRCTHVPDLAQPAADSPSVSLVRPLCGVEAFERETLLSSFMLNYPNYEIVFCVADAQDPVIGLVDRLMASFPQIPARLIIGDEKVSANPKLNNVVRGWDESRFDWIIMADSNVLMPEDYIQRMMARWTPTTGLVCACPIGARPSDFAGELECAFLNTYEARWQYTAERLGLGFAQGKSMLWRRDILERGGGVRALASELAEDAAASKLVHAQGLKIHLVEGPFVQLLGPRKLSAVWSRQLRWARLRRVTFPLFFAPEVLTSAIWTIAAAGIAAALSGRPGWLMALIVAAIWYGVEARLARAAHWQFSLMSLPAYVLRDLFLPILWLQAWMGDDFVWRGHSMNVKEESPNAGQS